MNRYSSYNIVNILLKNSYQEALFLLVKEIIFYIRESMLCM
jgi:hypothetical protein